MTTNLVHKITKATDLDQIKEITAGIIGETCWKASLSYGDELTLHIGAKIPYPQKSMAGKEKGSWILGTRATAWKLDSATDILATSEDDGEIIKQQMQVIEGSKIIMLETTYPSLNLTIKFDNECQLKLLPNAEDSLDLPDWEIFTPDRMILKVSGTRWSYTCSDSK
ncbi:MAG: hypothetical protein H0X31_20835 [Nostocaceae cyanobacterium]|nr:hypothetical protein [Nostocaceae cyanobacterium]